MTRYLRISNNKLPGEVTPRRAARLLGIHEGTVYRWCQEAMDGNGKLRGAVRKSITGWYYIDAKAIENLGKAAPGLDENEVSAPSLSRP